MILIIFYSNFCKSLDTYFGIWIDQKSVLSWRFCTCKT